MNAIWFIVAIYVETHGLTKVMGTTMHIWKNQLAEATCKENGIHGSDHSLHATAATHFQASIDEQVVIEYTGTIAAWVHPVIPESKTIWPDSALDNGLM